MNWLLLALLIRLNPVSALPVDEHAHKVMSAKQAVMGLDFAAPYPVMAAYETPFEKRPVDVNLEMGGPNVVIVPIARSAHEPKNLNATPVVTTDRVAEVGAKPKATEPNDATIELRAPSQAARTAFDYLRKVFAISPQTANRNLISSYIATFDGNVCHLAFRFYYMPEELDLQYDIDLADVQLDTIKKVGISDGWPGFELKTVLGKQFRVGGSVMGSALRPTDSIKLLFLPLILQPNDTSIFDALLTLAKQCGAK